MMEQSLPSFLLLAVATYLVGAWIAKFLFCVGKCVCAVLGQSHVGSRSSENMRERHDPSPTRSRAEIRDSELGTYQRDIGRVRD
jgi:hypothetical protein